MDEPGHLRIDRTMELVAAAQRGDRKACEELFARHAPRVLRIVGLRLGWKRKDHQDHEDIAQDALLKVFRALDGFRPQERGSWIGGFRAWLACCVESEIRDYLRRCGRQKPPCGVRLGELGTEDLAGSIFADRGPSPSGIARAKELEERLESSLLELAPRYREVIVLRRLCELEYDEIAERLGYASGASARLACHHALKKLEKLLAQREG